MCAARQEASRLVSTFFAVGELVMDGSVHEGHASRNDQARTPLAAYDPDDLASSNTETSASPSLKTRKRTRKFAVYADCPEESDGQPRVRRREPRDRQRATVAEYFPEVGNRSQRRFLFFGPPKLKFCCNFCGDRLIEAPPPRQRFWLTLLLLRRYACPHCFTEFFRIDRRILGFLFSHGSKPLPQQPVRRKRSQDDKSERPKRRRSAA